MVSGALPCERELIEQRSLFDLPMSHHDLQSCQLDRLNHGSPCAATAAFFNRIGQKATFPCLWRISALPQNADIDVYERPRSASDLAFGSLPRADVVECVELCQRRRKRPGP